MMTQRQLFDADSFASMIGVEILEYGQGRARVALDAQGEHLNGFGSVHGGAIFSLADEAFALACNSRGRVAVAASASIVFLSAGRRGRLLATAEELSCSHKLSSYQVRVTDEDGTLVALFQGTAYRKSEELAVEG
jgi:acyl-CoA thioesterase